ncbi:hypothetical protein [Bifidobacterium leontopitheci]|uniref:Uncharacterized protein n=1 Tax=Bifidobacterium leontopitheci TaxID=2650774 RepID=A0A6I1GKX6_9BIFI|nr:hypothetical protein [Bifidobacterium leontopitheci]KAB7791442.1 hypothetical protein F7D09_0117 [Bifidobacterium leontopitheci]
MSDIYKPSSAGGSRDGSGPASPWSDGRRRPFTPREVIAGVTGGFDQELAGKMLADDVALAYVNRYLTRYRALAGHLPYPYESRIERECNEPTEDGDADLKVALAIGYGVPDSMFDELQQELDDWDGAVTMGAMEFDAELASLLEPVLLGDETGERPAVGEHWDVEFSSQRCRVRVRRDTADDTLTVAVDMPERDGLHRLTLRFADGSDLTLDIDVKRGSWRRGGIDAGGTGLPTACTLS